MLDSAIARKDSYDSFVLGPPIRRRIDGLPEFCMRIQDSIRNTVAFVGFEDNRAECGGINCVGTVFFLEYDGGAYLVTARHVAKQLNDTPFLLRLNKTDNIGSQNVHIDGMQWIYHQDANVDAAVFPFDVRSHEHYASYITQPMILNEEKAQEEYIGIGCQCYIVGLFRLMAGQKRNLPVVHAGSIALLPGDEKIPVTDWDDPDGRRVRYVNGYLVEAQSLAGLSGSPVFVRPSVDFPILMPQSGRQITARSPRNEIYLLGLWQAAWKAPPAEFLGVAQQGHVTVPVGMGVVVPMTQIMEILDLPELKEQRRNQRDSHITPASLQELGKTGA